MSSQRTNVILGLAVAGGLVGFALALGGPPDRDGGSTSPQQIDREVELLARAPALDDFRVEFRDVLSSLFDLAVLQQNDTSQYMALTAMAEIDQLTYEDLDGLAAAGVDFSRMQRAVEDVRGLIVERMSLPLAGTDCPVPMDDLMSPPWVDADYTLGPNRVPGLVFQIGLEALAVARLLHAQITAVCELVVAGFNISVPCNNIADAILFIAQEVFAVLVRRNDGIDTAEIEGTYERLCHLHAEIVEIVEANADLVEKIDMILAQNCEVINLLNTQPWRRNSNIPSCDGLHDNWPFEYPEDPN